MIPGLYVTTDRWGDKTITAFTDPDNPYMGREVCEVGGEEDSDGDMELTFTPYDSDQLADTHSYPCTDGSVWELICPMSALRGPHTLARDEGVLLTVLSVMFVGHIDLEGLDAWIDGAELPAGSIVAEPFRNIEMDDLRKITLENYETAGSRLETMRGVQ